MVVVQHLCCLAMKPSADDKGYLTSMEEWLEEEEREDRLAVRRPCEAALARRSRRSARLSLSLFRCNKSIPHKMIRSISRQDSYEQHIRFERKRIEFLMVQHAGRFILFVLMLSPDFLALH